VPSSVSPIAGHRLMLTVESWTSDDPITIRPFPPGSPLDARAGGCLACWRGDGG